MTMSRQRALLNGQTAIARKVFSAIPITESWTARQIYSELCRLGHSVDFKVQAGCLAALICAGLVIEPTAGNYRRAAVKQFVELTKPEAKPGKTVIAAEVTAATRNKDIEMEAKPAAALKPALIKNPAPHIDKLAMISNQARGIADQLKDLASNIETAAIEIDEQIKTGNEETAKLKQLQQLLKSLG